MIKRKWRATKRLKGFPPKKISRFANYFDNGIAQIEIIHNQNNAFSNTINDVT